MIYIGNIIAYLLNCVYLQLKAGIPTYRLTTQLEETVIRTLHGFGVVGERSDVNTGVWVRKNKISAVGLTASRWITMHGIALNVNCDLAHFDQIIPCGIALSDRGVCSLQSLHDTLAGHLSGESFAFEDPAAFSAAEKLDINLVAARWVKSFEEVFGLEMCAAGTGSNTDERHESAVAELDSLVESFPAIRDLQVQYYQSPADS